MRVSVVLTPPHAGTHAHSKDESAPTSAQSLGECSSIQVVIQASTPNPATNSTALQITLQHQMSCKPQSQSRGRLEVTEAKLIPRSSLGQDSGPEVSPIASKIQSGIFIASDSYEP
eukprot:Blabericola_migrator_1__4897@NODE_2559_length_2613_cov_36_886881_g1599_i0_p2_GENE_NODE_2559_length_2613_cov_36_886881_g1599_i0NODE_2559_length_2613_cov_36_886881_g1599_i0_p2_ORF_typecomplete_len116_score6_04_NODE_2559_length_2613_cov_36_886881_g1599_i018962243